MQYTNELAQGIRQRDVMSIRAAIIGYFDTTSENTNVLSIADTVSNELSVLGISLFEQDDKRLDFISTEDYSKTLISLRAKLRTNFSREKIAYGDKLLAKIPYHHATIPSADSANVTQTISTHNPRNENEAKPTLINHTNQIESGRLAMKQNFVECKNSVPAPKELVDAIEAKDRSAVIAILFGFLDVFDKTEQVPVIDYAAFAATQLHNNGVQLFDKDDERVDLNSLSLTSSSLISLKAKLRTNFSLEKLTAAAKIAQAELAKKLAERKVKEEAERKAREDAERKAREDAERKAREDAERKAREDAVRNKAKKERQTEVIYVPGFFENLGKKIDSFFGTSGHTVRRTR